MCRRKPLIKPNIAYAVRIAMTRLFKLPHLESGELKGSFRK